MQLKETFNPVVMHQPITRSGWARIVSYPVCLKAACLPVRQGVEVSR